MADFLSKALGNEGVAEAIGKQAGRAVEVGVKKVISGNKSNDGKKKEAGAPGAGAPGAGAPGAGAPGAGAPGAGAPGAGGGDFNMADALGDGGGLGKAVGGFFK